MFSRMPPLPPLLPTLSHPEHPPELLLYRLAKLSAASSRVVTHLCERRYGITRREWGVLMWLAHEPGIQPSVLAERLELDRARVSRALNSLLTKGLVARTHNASNRREALLHLTQPGMVLHDELWPQIRAINVQLLNDLSTRDVQALDRALQSLQQQALAMERGPDDNGLYPSRREGSRHV
ncbi:MarR family winged helix-turn-helix transcriptional regulator [Diaphorobacter caeni]|uniref:MarR family winged helix-turn-helix transcriptional regulator n=1 Tax=Diaphorobacter caeni TaxID=2784387 RepID=UPI002B2746AB|nr:MarR family transcriptional regulator [Diaphorobacter caeni]